jgi:iron complex transport system substrate-binding protein
MLGNPNAHSASTTWEAVATANPDVLVVAPCGFGLSRAAADMPALAARPGWRELRAVQAGEVYVADGNRFFNRSGPTVFETIPLLAELLHPEVVPRRLEGTVYRRW